MNRAKVRIERAGVDDIDAVAEMFDLYRQFYDQDPDPVKCRAYIEKRITRSESVIFVASDAEGEKALGFTQLYPTFCSVEASRIFVLYDLFVRREVRNLGVGRQLMKQAELHARSAGASRLQLETHHTNRNAQHLYESLGYKKDEEFFTYALAL
ncbi:GNAT family N-acetyltransferase [Pseudomonadota bacterium]